MIYTPASEVFEAFGAVIGLAEVWHSSGDPSIAGEIGEIAFTEPKIKLSHLVKASKYNTRLWAIFGALLCRHFLEIAEASPSKNKPKQEKEIVEARALLRGCEALLEHYRSETKAEILSRLTTDSRWKNDSAAGPISLKTFLSRVMSGELLNAPWVSQEFDKVELAVEAYNKLFPSEKTE